MRILFSIEQLGQLWMFEGVLRRLALHGHDLLIVTDRREWHERGQRSKAVFADLPRIQWHPEPPDRPTRWDAPAALVRAWLDYLRYFERPYANAPRLRRRIGQRLPPMLRHIAEWAGLRTAVGRRALSACLRVIERALPRRQGIDAVMREYRPDAVLVTPLIRLGSSQVDVLRSARAFGTRTAICVASWDHLSSKGRITELADRVFVWNATQRWEATTLHGVPGDRVVVTGAQCYDRWFDRAPRRDRQRFCGAMKLAAERPFLFYVCSALYPHSRPREAQFVRGWIEQIRASDDPVLQSAGILIRPHPDRIDEWRKVDVSALPGVTLCGTEPPAPGDGDDYFESLYYSAAVIGLNTSAFLEAAIVGRPVHTIVVPELSERQEGTLHFHYLLSVGGGLLRLARSFDEHRSQLAESLRAVPRADLNADFVRAFIRPHGLETPATDVFCDAVIQLLQLPVPASVRPPFWSRPVRVAAWPMLALLHRLAMLNASEDQWWARRQARRNEARERLRQERLRGKRASERAKADAHAAREAARSAKRALRERAQAEKAAVRRRKELARLSRGTPAG